MSNFRTRLITVFTVCCVAALVLVPSASAAATRTWVSGVGDDVNPCSRTAPCKTWAGAISKTAGAGEMNAMDSGGFGSLTITKSMTIDGAGVHASTLNALTTGFIINGANIEVVIRNVSIHSGPTSDPLPVPAPACSFTGTHGIRVMNARSVRLENVSIDGQATNGVWIDPAADSDIDVSLDDVRISNICGTGIKAISTTTGRADVHVGNSSITGAGTAISAGLGSATSVAGTTFFGNGVALAALDGASITGMGGNVLVANATPSAFTSDTSLPVPVNPTPVTVNPTAITVQTVVTPVPLVVALADSTLASLPGRAVALQYAATTVADARLEIRRGTAGIVASVDGRAKRGSNSITWNGKINGKPAGVGTYTLKLILDGAGDASATASATVKVGAPRIASNRVR